MKNIMIVCLLVITTIFIAGCDPTKTGGGGQQQPYNSDTGQYK